MFLFVYLWNDFKSVAGSKAKLLKGFIIFIIGGESNGKILTLKVPEKLQLYGLYVYYVVHICDFGMLRVKVEKCWDWFRDGSLSHTYTVDSCFNNILRMNITLFYLNFYKNNRIERNYFLLSKLL